jgi:hypothetical protein
MPTIVGRCPHNLLRNFDFINERVGNVCSSSALPNTWTASIFVNLRNSRKKLFNTQKMDKGVHMKWRFHSYNKISFHGAFENVLLQVHGLKWQDWWRHCKITLQFALITIVTFDQHEMSLKFLLNMLM